MIKSLTAKTVGTYWVMVSDSFGCSANDTFNLISINTLPKDFLPKNLNVCMGEKFTLNGFNSYYWMTGETTPTISLITFPIYSVIVTDNNSCSGSDSMNIFYNGNLNIQQINSFSPNGDGINDIFKPILNNCILNFNLRIYTRSGQLVFETKNSNIGWDGKFNGNYASVGVYYYVINYKNLEAKEFNSSGSLTLIR